MYVKAPLAYLADDNDKLELHWRFNKQAGIVRRSAKLL